MTFSIVARSADGAALGIAVASKFLAVGAAVPAGEAEVGALATQAYANLAYRADGLRLLRDGATAAETVERLVAADPGRDERQLGVVGRAGDGATFTGAKCHDWAGGTAGDGFAIQGNILTGPDVVDAMRTAWLAGTPAAGAAGAAGAPLARRLLDALTAGDHAGGDRRGRQSAALLVVRMGGGYGGTSDVEVDLRVDDGPDPVPELGRLLELHELYFGRPDPETLIDLTGELAVEVADRLARLGHLMPGDGRVPAADLDAALASWAGIENLEERLVPGRIDPLVLATLRKT
jgi:uncharacterized Ntn-hydrolase superfamily protein